MTRKMLITAMALTCVILQTAGVCLAERRAARPPEVDHPSLMLDSGLWRAQFLKSIEEAEVRDADARSIVRTDSAPDRTSGTSGPVEGSLLSAPLPPLREMMPEVPLVNFSEDLLTASTEERHRTGNAVQSASEAMTLSDWQLAVAGSVTDKGKLLSNQGPSLISLVVGIVGLIVIVGAYLKGGKTP